MIQKKSDKMWKNHKGNDVPREYVPAFEVTKESAVAKIFKSAETINNQLLKFKSLAFSVTDSLYTQMLADANINSGDKKGNYTIYNFDKSVKVEVNVSDRIEFGEEINFAQIKLNEFIQVKTAGGDSELHELISNAFTTNKGRLDTKRILSLFTLKITHTLWVEAMELIKKAIQTNSSVRYLTVSTRDENGKYNLLNLNFSNV
jgi:hypothetical protein